MTLFSGTGAENECFNLTYNNNGGHESTFADVCFCNEDKTTIITVSGACNKDDNDDNNDNNNIDIPCHVSGATGASNAGSGSF